MDQLSFYRGPSVLVMLGLLAAAGSPAFSQPCLPPPEGLVAWWPGEGNTDDIAGLSDGTPQGGLSYDSGQVGEAFLLDGVDDFVEIGDPAALEPPALDSFTLVAWVNRTGPHGGPFPEFQIIVGRASLLGDGTPGYYLRWKNGHANFVTVTDINDGLECVFRPIVITDSGRT